MVYWENYVGNILSWAHSIVCIPAKFNDKAHKSLIGDNFTSFNHKKRGTFIRRASAQLSKPVVISNSPIPTCADIGEEESISDRLSRRISGRFTNRKTITENLPEDSILNDVFNFDEWEKDWEIAKRRQTVTMGALPENQLTEKDMDWVGFIP